MDLTSILGGGIAVLMLLAAIALLVYRRHNRINAFWALLAILFSGSTMLLAVVGSSVGTIYANPSGDPRSSVTEFFDALVTGDYETAYSLMDDYSDLGLAAEPESEAGKLIYRLSGSNFVSRGGFGPAFLCEVRKVRGLKHHKGVDGVKTVSRVPGRKRPGTCFSGAWRSRRGRCIVTSAVMPYIGDR